MKFGIIKVYFSHILHTLYIYTYIYIYSENDMMAKGLKLGCPMSTGPTGLTACKCVQNNMHPSKTQIFIVSV